MAPRHILVVEDDPWIGASLTELFTAHGYLATLSTTGADATGVCERDTPDLVLLDAGLPDVDGFTLCRWLREQFRDLPIILVTARDAEIDIVVGLDAGADDYVTKPFSPSKLIARISRLVKKEAEVA